MKNETTIITKVKAFSHERAAKIHTLLISPDGTVRVWDDVAQQYTLCHCLSPAAQKRSIRKAGLAA